MRILQIINKSSNTKSSITLSNDTFDELVFGGYLQPWEERSVSASSDDAESEIRNLIQVIANKLELEAM